VVSLIKIVALLKMKNKYNFFDIQEQVLSFWESHNQKNNEILSSKKIYSIDTPPPTVSGSLHIGHVFSYTHQDFIARYKRKKGFSVIYPFGFDDNGLPTEKYIEKKERIKSYQYDKKDFIKRCLVTIEEAHQTFISLWKKIGLSCDWNLLYSTISDDVKKLSQKLFITLYSKGVLYRKMEPSLYCAASRSTVSQAELEEIERMSEMVTVSFRLADFHEQTIMIATTRPELLAGCVAVLVHPEDERYASLIGKKAIVPLYNTVVPIIADKEVIPEKGTGIVMTATFGDALDVAWFKKYQFSYKNVIGRDGKITSLGGFLEGLKVSEARQLIIAKLEEEGWISNKEKVLQRVSVFERSKKEIEYILLEQWFIDVTSYKEEWLRLGKELTWHPSYMRARYEEWVSNLSWDWCISRQRAFGIPFPVWYDKKGKIIIADVNDLPVDPTTALPKGYTQDEVVPDTDVMDTWNTSSLTPYIIKNLYKEKYGKELDLPLSLRPQSHDIIRTWTFDTIVKSFFIDNNLPWKDVLISGHVLSSQKEKISKSKGNSAHSVESLLSLYPSDVIRYWTASAKAGTDTSFSEDTCRDGNRLLVKLYNAALCIENFAFFKKDYSNISFDCLDSFEKHVLLLLQNMKDSYHRFFNGYDYTGALREIELFFWFFCDYYLEVMKVYQYKGDQFDEQKVIFVKNFTGFLFSEIIDYLSPFLPFITEHFFHLFYSKKKDESIHWSCYTTFLNEKNSDVSSFVVELITRVRKAKSEQNVSLKSEIKLLEISFSQSFDCSILGDSSLCRMLEILLNTKKITSIKQGERHDNVDVDHEWLSLNEGKPVLRIFM
jgi:valyl-tRNA synthetase